ncbi:MAG: molybdopterin-guanine dinucleotide biosynthesis protein B [Hyphomicrobiaceae bacterium]
MKTITGLNGTPVIGIAGWKKSGKTTLTVRLVTELTRRGYRIASVKHAHHDLQVDASETDSARHRRAGAAQVAVVSSERWALITELKGAAEPDFAAVIAMFEPCDLIVVEGYKSAPIAKIEARRTASFTREPIAPNDPRVIAIAADHATDAHGLPLFSLDDIDGLVALLITHFGLDSQGRAPAGAAITAKAANDLS